MFQKMYFWCMNEDINFFPIIRSSLAFVAFIFWYPSCLGSLQSNASVARICQRKVREGQNPLFASGFYMIIFTCTEMSTCDITIFRLSWRLVHVIVSFISTV